MTVIAMTREMGSRGNEVALAVARTLRLELLHHEVVERQLADRLQVRESAVRRYLEGGDHAFGRWRMQRKGLDFYTAEQIFDLAEAGDVLIRGWGAAQLLRPVPHVVTVRVCAPLVNRVRTLMQRVGMRDPETARREILASDAAQSRVVKRLSGFDWQDPQQYDLVLNTARLPVEACVAQLLALARLPGFRPTADSRAILMAEKRRHQGTPNAVLPSGIRARSRPGSGTSAGDRPVRREDRDLLL